MSLNDLAKKYYDTKDRKVIDEIFKKITKQLDDKARYVFYKQKYRGNHKSFKLCDIGTIEKDDILNELACVVLELINRYDGVRPFDTYLFSTLWYWKPKFINKEFIADLGNVRTEIKENDETPEDVLANIAVMPKIEDEIIIDNLFTNLTDREREIIKILQESPESKQTELADRLGVTKQAINQSLDAIRKKYKPSID